MTIKVIDLFAGYGGFSTGAEQAGAKVVWAANHWQHAVDTHARNHPTAEHSCQDLRQADFSETPAHDMVLASPSCQGNSRAGQPARKRSKSVKVAHDKYRATAFAVIDCVDVTRPKAFLVENTEDFELWSLSDLWCDMLRRLGYKLTIAKLWAHHMGVPQRRKRLFIAGALDKAPNLTFAREAEPAFGPCIDWHEGDWRPWANCAPRARQRIAAAQKKRGKRFLTQHVSNHPGVPLHESIRTITTKDQWGVVDGDLYRPLTRAEIARGMGFPASYETDATSRSEWMRGFGNAVPPPMAKRLVERVGQHAATDRAA